MASLNGDIYSMIIHVQPVEALAGTPDDVIRPCANQKSARQRERAKGSVGLQYDGSQARSAVWSRQHPMQTKSQINGRM